MQQPDQNGYLLALAFLKHYDAYSQEANRHNPWDFINISRFDFFDSYLPQYEIAFKQGNASGAMCSCECPASCKIIASR
eukprot:SAG31_NODE_7096_length_1789_cov_4.807692_1_plen_79_part_00